MPISVRASHFTKQTATTGLPFTTADITGLTFTPKAILLWGIATNSGLTTIERPFIGFSTGPQVGQNYAVAWNSDNGIPSNTYRRARNDYCVSMSGTSPVHMKVASFNADGVSFTYDTNDANAHRIYYLALGGSDITNVKAGEFNLNTTTGNQDITAGDRTRMVWQTTRTAAVQQDLSNQTLDSNDYIVMHLGVGVTISQTYINAMNAVTVVPNSNKGIECFSLADLENNAPIAAANGWGFIVYDLEKDVGGAASPAAEEENPISSFQSAKTIADNNGLELHSAASNFITSQNANIQAIAPLVTVYHLQSQPKQDDDSTGTIMDDWIKDRVALIKSYNSSCVVTYQVTLSGNIAPGDADAYTTAKRCIDKTSPNTAANGPDGLSIWYNGTTWDNGQFKDLHTYHESKYGGIAFAPDIVFFIGADAANGTVSEINTSWFYGAGKNSGAQNVICFSEIDNVSTTDTARHQRTDRCIAYFANGSTSATAAEASYVGAINHGFRINVTKAPTTSRPVYYLAIKGGSWNTGAIAQPAAAQQQTTSGLNHTPKAVMFRSYAASQGTGIIAHARWAMGAADSASSQWALTGGSNDGATAIPHSFRGNLLTDVIRTAQGSDPAVDVTAVADLVSFGSGNFVLNWDPVIEGTARQHLYVTVGDNVGGPVSSVVDETVGVNESVTTAIDIRHTPTTDQTGITESVTTRLISRVTPPTDEVSIAETVHAIVAEHQMITPPTDTVGITESVYTSVSEGKLIAGSMLKFYLSGGILNDDPALSLGGARSEATASTGAADFYPEEDFSSAAEDFYGSSGVVSGSALIVDRLFGDVTKEEVSTPGGVRAHRCFYAVNTHSTKTMYDVHVWVALQPQDSGIRIRLAVGVADTDEDEPSITDQYTPPPIVVFREANDMESAIRLGNLSPGSYRAVWIERYVPQDTLSRFNDKYALQGALYSDHD